MEKVKPQNDGWMPCLTLLTVAVLGGMIFGAFMTWGTTHTEYVDRIEYVENATILCKCDVFQSDQWMAPETCAKVQGEPYWCKFSEEVQE